MLNTRWHIVPRNDGYHYLALDDKNQVYLQHKAEECTHTPLVFKEESEASAYIIRTGLDPEEYVPGIFYTIEEYCYE